MNSSYSPSPIIRSLHHVSRFGYLNNLTFFQIINPGDASQSYGKGLGVNGGIIIGFGILLTLFLLFIYFAMCCCLYYFSRTRAEDPVSGAWCGRDGLREFRHFLADSLPYPAPRQTEMQELR
ncbi:MAG: hypothetical protein P4L87_07145, partial [Formivibrio sp.]|nr:hypothetical protein [Formivibrio sp.]